MPFIASVINELKQIFMESFLQELLEKKKNVYLPLQNKITNP